MVSTLSQLRPLRWQGLSLDLPGTWDPVKLEGDASQGLMLLADLTRPKLGMRWKTLKSKTDVAKSVESAMVDEVGRLAANETVDTTPPGDEWQAGKLYIEPDPPGRDVWVGYSRATKRLVQVVYHVQGRDRVLPDQVLPTLADESADWAIFDLSCTPLPGSVLEKHRLNVGDLALEFHADRKPLVIRQIAVASVALTRQPIERWLAAQQLTRKKFYRPIEQPQPIEIGGLKGVSRRIVRRRRHFLMRSLQKTLIGVALLDESRDKLLIVEAPEMQDLEPIIRSIGRTHKD